MSFEKYSGGSSGSLNVSSTHLQEDNSKEPFISTPTVVELPSAQFHSAQPFKPSRNFVNSPLLIEPNHSPVAQTQQQNGRPSTRTNIKTTTHNSSVMVPQRSSTTYNNRNSTTLSFNHGASGRAHISSQNRRSLFFLFLIAVYTTFGLTVYNLPVVSIDDYAYKSNDAVTEKESDVSASMLGLSFEEDKLQSLRTIRKEGSGNGHVAFARRFQPQSPVYFRRSKEVKDFYRQQEVLLEYDYSWYINCGALGAVVLWAWREARNSAETDVATTTTTSEPDEPLSLLD